MFSVRLFSVKVYFSHDNSDKKELKLLLTKLVCSVCDEIEGITSLLEVRVTCHVVCTRGLMSNNDAEQCR